MSELPNNQSYQLRDQIYAKSHPEQIKTQADERFSTSRVHLGNAQYISQSFFTLDMYLLILEYTSVLFTTPDFYIRNITASFGIKSHRHFRKLHILYTIALSIFNLLCCVRVTHVYAL